MSRTAERVLEEIRGLHPDELRRVWEQLNRFVSELNSPSVTVQAPVSDEEFAAALDEVTGCTPGSRSLDRLLQERQDDLEAEQRRLRSRGEK